MKRDFLRNLGVDEDIVNQIMAEAGKEITAFKNEIAELKDAIQEKDGIIETKKTKIKELEGVDLEALKKTAYDEGLKAGNAEVEKFKFDSALETALKEAKVRDSKAISGYLDREKLKFEEGKIVGLEEQINPLKESHDFLFVSDDKKPTFAGTTPGTQPSSSGLDDLMSVMGIKKD